MCVCSLSYTACKAHAPYYIVICGLSGSTIFFPHILVKGAIFTQKLLKIKYVFFLFSTQPLSETHLILRIQRDIIINIRRFSCKLPFLLSGFNETCIIGQLSEKYWDIIFHENTPIGSRVVSCGRTDRQTDVTKLMLVFLCELA